MVLRLFFLFLTFVSASSSWAGEVAIVGKLGNWSFTTDNIRSRSESASGFGAYNVQLSYGVLDHWNLCVGFNMLMSSGLSGSQGYGIDAGANYYPLTNSTSSTTQATDVQLTMTEIWRPYVGFHLRQRTFNFVLATTFLGTGLAVGTDYQIGTDWFLNFEGRYDMLFGADDGEATQVNFLIGAGLEF